MPDLGGRVAEVDQRFKVRTAQVEHPLKRGFGKLGLSGGNRRFTDEAPQLVVARRHPTEGTEELVDHLGIVIEERRFESAELAGEILARVAVVLGVGENARPGGAKPPPQVPLRELPTGGSLPAVDDLRPGHDALVLEQPGEVFDAGVRNRETVLDRPETIGEVRHRPSDLAQRLLERRDAFEQMLFELLLRLEKDLVLELGVVRRDPGQDEKLVTAPPTVLEAFVVGGAAELTQHRLSPPRR